MADTARWTILGQHPVAESLRIAARDVETPIPITISTDPNDAPETAFAIGPAVLSSTTEHVVPYYSAFEAIEIARQSLHNGETGKVYGCFTSFRIARGATADQVSFSALLPALAVTLDLLPGQVLRVHARCASLLSSRDAWFVTIVYADETIATIEAIATLDPAAVHERDLLIELTASDRVLRAEPMRQAVIVERLGHPPAVHPWWENHSERFLKLVARRALEPHRSAGSRLRAIWGAIQESAENGTPLTL